MKFLNGFMYVFNHEDLGKITASIILVVIFIGGCVAAGCFLAHLHNYHNK